MQATQDHVGNLVAEKHSDVRLKLEALVNALAANELENIKAANTQLEASLTALGNVVARQNWPSWLSNMIKHTRNYQTNHGNGLATWVAHLRSVMDNRSALENHNWFSSSEDQTAFDVDRLIEAARVEFKIDDLFERLITTLRGLASCDELDSAKAIKDLQEIISILQHARSESFTAQHTTWQFVRRFVPNLITAYVKRSDIAGPVIDAYEQTAQELDINFGKAKDQISERLLDAAQKSFKSEAVKGIGTHDLSALPPE